MFDLKHEVKLAFSENKTAIITSILILFLSLVLGYLFQPNLDSLLNPVVEELTDKVETGVIKLTFADIFLNNIMVVFRMFILGILFCFSAVILAFNGFFVGYYAACQPNLFEVLVYTVPHGIFEFSSCILACASGFVLFNFAYKLIKTFISENEFKLSDRFTNAFDVNFDKLKQALILLAISAVLMAVSGFVEAYVTLPLGNYIISVVG